MAITITRWHQPNTIETWVIESHSPVIAEESDHPCIKAREKAGWINVKGRILNSRTTNRLFSATVTQTVESQPLSDQMPAEYLKDGATYVTVAM